MSTTRTSSPLRVEQTHTSSHSDDPGSGDLSSFPDEVVLGWGRASREVGLLIGASERLPFGPQSIAVAPDGSVWILDPHGRRLVHLDPQGAWLDPQPCPPGATDLTVDRQGRPVVLSRVNRRVSVIGPPDHEVAVPAPIRHVTGVLPGADDHVLIATAHQETFDLGRPGDWIDWPQLLVTRRTGIPGRSAGPRVQAMLRDGRALLLYPNQSGSPDDRSETEVPLAKTEGVASVVVLDSLPDRSTIVLLEWFVDGRVERTIRLNDADGVAVREVRVPSSPLFFPFREFAPAAGSTILQLYPQEDGLHIRTIRLGGAK